MLKVAGTDSEATLPCPALSLEILFSKSESEGSKDCQGLELPPGVRGKGIKGRGQGTQLVTPEKPLPLPGVSRVFLLPNF